MRIKLHLKPLIISAGLLAIYSNAWAHVSSNKLAVNSINGDHITAMASFPSRVSGDLYLATEFNGQILFIGQNAALSFEPLAFKSNGNFSADLPVLDLPCEGIPAGTYPLYQVVTQPGSNPMDFNNWIGGMSGLSKISFDINLNNTPTPSVNTSVGKAKYKDLGCSAGGCHKADPNLNTNHILEGISLAELKAAIQKNPSDMGFLADPADPQFASDADLQAIADYLKSL